MEKGKKEKKWMSLLLLFGCLLFSLSSTTLAISAKEEKSITFSNLKEWNDGAKVTKKAEGKGKDYKVKITADTLSLPEDYYSVYIYDDTKRNIKNYDGISFLYTNESEEELNINVTLTINAKTSVTMNESSYAIVEDANENTTQVIHTTYGTLSIPAHFTGTIYVPFTQFFNEENENISISNIQSFGITTVLEKEQSVSYSIGNPTFLAGSLNSMKDSYYQITLSGEENIIVPNTGSVIQTYKAEVLDLYGDAVEDTPFFSVEEGINGVTITENGTLEIQNDCDASKVTIYAKTDKSSNAGSFTVSLERLSAEVAAVGVPGQADVKKITTPLYDKLVGGVLWIRIAFGIAVFFLFTIFITWFTKAKENYEIVRKRLYKIVKEQEEDKT